jgi:hypothetical protein
MEKLDQMTSGGYMAREKMALIEIEKDQEENEKLKEGEEKEKVSSGKVRAFVTNV